jgi:predicted RNase H-like HicB family nuclease
MKGTDSTAEGKEKYLVVIESGPGNYGAYSPDVLGCVSVGDTFEETLSEFRSALAFHFAALD